jgi:undecaprenyl diphosphate synthase
MSPFMQIVPPSPPPRHIAVIMDGNGRWAQARGLPRTAGHKQGIEALRRTVKTASDLGVDVLTVYSFSTENWSRPKLEVAFLLELFRHFMRQDVAELHASGIRIRMIGSRKGLERGLLSLIVEAEQLTAKNTGMTLVVAFNYGGQQEIAEAAQQLARQVEAGTLTPAEISPEKLAACLNTAGMPNPDLLIRTGGEERISNFLLWQCAYSEFVFMDEYWPDFDGALLQKAIASFHRRDRRYGGVKAQSA